MSTLRPAKLNDIVGQEDIKNCIRILIQARAKDALPHMLFHGFTGCGKTTFARAIANEVGANILLANGGNIKKAKDILPYLVRLKRRDILFIDEVHRVDVRVQEALFTVMEDFRFDVAKGAKSINLEPFSLFGATTEAGLLLRPFFDRFEHNFHLDYYSISELITIIQRNSKKLGYMIDNDAAKVLAKLSRFTPRIANSLLVWCSDFAKSNYKTKLDLPLVIQAIKLKGIDAKGMDKADRLYLSTLQKVGKPLGLMTICAMSGLSRETVEKQIEPYLFKLGMIDKTPKGRILI